MLLKHLIFLSLLLCGAWASTTTLYHTCISGTNYCVDLLETPPCGLAIQLTAYGIPVINRAFDLALSEPSVCFQLAGCNNCVTLGNLTIDSKGEVHPCLTVTRTDCSKPSDNLNQFLGCITASNNLASCLTQGCPKGCSGHGECMSNGKCDCNNGWFGDDCADVEPLFDQCATVPSYGNLCLNIEYTTCAIQASLYGTLTDFPSFKIPLYNTTITAPHFNTYFGSAACFNIIQGCTACLYFDHFKLNSTYAYGCPTLNFSCPLVSNKFPAELQYKCFEDTGLVADCFGNCPLNCSNHGSCIDGNCKCDDGYGGASCERMDCSEVFECYGHGECIGPNKCQCTDGYYGDWCAGAKCDAVDQCSQNGQCNEPNVCSCDDGYTGPTCAELKCASPCLNGGSCVSGSCKCAEGWEGGDCSTKSSSSKKKNNSHTPYVIGGVVAGLALAGAVVGGVYFFKQKRANISNNRGSLYDSLENDDSSGVN